MDAKALKGLALQAGATLVGIADLEQPFEHATALRRFTSECRFGPMEWWPKHEELRLQPSKLLANAKSVLMIGVAYEGRPDWTKKHQHISAYALGRDYHKTLKQILLRVARQAQEHHQALGWRVCVDTAPFPERYWAWKAGLGWLGKNTLLIHPRLGSYFFLGALLLDRPFEADRPQPDRCGRCTACLEACPTQALESAQELNAAKCMSAWTIEHRHDETGEAKAFPTEFNPMPEGWIFGCDSCQSVCPWNQKCEALSHPDFQVDPIFLKVLEEKGFAEDYDSWDRLTKGRALRRMSHVMYQRNLKAAKTRS
jgi:epoxyqueuosine reductase